MSVYVKLHKMALLWELSRELYEYYISSWGIEALEHNIHKLNVFILLIHDTVHRRHDFSNFYEYIYNLAKNGHVFLRPFLIFHFSPKNKLWWFDAKPIPSMCPFKADGEVAQPLLENKLLL